MNLKLSWLEMMYTKKLLLQGYCIAPDPVALGIVAKIDSALAEEHVKSMGDKKSRGTK